jgi:nucleoside diphosphate kinase
MTKIFVMIKPWGVSHAGEIFKRLDRVGKRLEIIEIASIPEGAIKLQHAKYQGQRFFQLMISDLTGKPAVIALYEGNQEEFIRQRDYLRKEFGRDIIPLPPLRRSALHVSDSGQEFNRDFNAWGEYLDGNKRSTR